MASKIPFSMTQRLVTEEGKPTSSAIHLLNRLTSLIDVNNAAKTSAFATSVPNGYVWNSDAAGAFPAGDPTFDITTVFYDEAKSTVATVVLRGTLTTSAGTIAITQVSNVPASGYTVTYALTNNGTSSALAVMTIAFPDGSLRDHSVAWNAVDLSVAGGTPATGGGK